MFVIPFRVFLQCTLKCSHYFEHRIVTYYNCTSVFPTRLEPDSPEMQMLHSVNKAFHEEVPNGLPSDIAPWLSLFYRSQEKKMENHFHKFLETLDKLYQKAKRDYVPGEKTGFLRVPRDIIQCRNTLKLVGIGIKIVTQCRSTVALRCNPETTKRSTLS